MTLKDLNVDYRDGVSERERVLVVIPTLNEGGAIRDVVERVRAELPDSDVLVIDGFSVDDTCEAALAGGANVLQVAKDFGIATAVEAGILYAYRRDYDYLVRIDGDGQHPPSAVHSLLDAVRRDEADFIIGSRFLGDADYKPQHLRGTTIAVVSFLLRVLHGVKVADCTSGCQVFNRRLIEFFGSHPNFEYSEIRAIWMSHEAGFRIREEFINMSQRAAGASSFSPVRALTYMFKNVVDLVLSVRFLWRRDAQP